MNRLPDLRRETIQWGIGAFCAAIGAIMLVVPHQFAIPTYAALIPQLPLWGAIFLGAGSGLYLAAFFRPRVGFVVALHAFAGAALLLLALAFAQSGVPSIALLYTVLGLGTILASLLPPSGPPVTGPARRDALALVVGFATAIAGLASLIAPGPFNTTFDTLRGHLTSYGFAVAGFALVFVHLRASPGPVSWAGHLVLAAVFWTLCVTGAIPTRTWTGVALYGGLGTIIGLLPWLGPRLDRVDPASLRVRLGLALAAATTLPLIVAIAVTTAQEQQAVEAQVLEQQRGLALSLAEQISDYVSLHRAAIAALAANPGLMNMTPTAQHELLRVTNISYPDVVAFSTFDADGNLIVSSDSRPLAGLAERQPFELMREARRSVLEVRMSALLQQPILVIWVPVIDEAGRFAGFVEGIIRSAWVAQNFTTAAAGQGTTAYLVDEQGRIVAHRDPALVLQTAASADLGPLPVLTPPDRSTARRRPSASGVQLAGYAVVPVLGWTVVVDRPVAVALAAVRARHDLFFGLLLGVMAMAALIGIVTADRVAAPLTSLTRAVSALASEAAPEPLPTAGVAEVQQLAHAFAQMRDRLIARTEEREHAEATLRQSEASFRLLFGANPQPMWVYDRESLRFLEVNEAAIARYGYGREEFLAMRTPDIRPAEDVERFVADVTAPRSAYRGPMEWRHRLKNGTVLEVEITSHTLDFGEYQAALVVAYDVTARKRVESGFRFLAEASGILGSSLDYRTTLAAVAHAAVPALADWSVFTVVEDGDVRELEVVHQNPDRLELARSLQTRYPPDPHAPYGIPEVLRTGKPELFEEIPEELLEAGAQDAEHLALIRELGLRSALIVPVSINGQVVGAITLVSAESGRRYGPTDLTLAEDLANRCAQAMQNARLYQAAEDAEEHVRALNAGLEERVVEHTAELEDRNQELEVLQDLSKSILNSADLDAVLYEILDKTMALGQFDLGNIRLLSIDGARLEPVAARGYRDPANMARNYGRDGELLATGSSSVLSMTLKQARVIEDLASETRRGTLHREGIISGVVVPLRDDERVLGVMQLGSRSPRPFEAAELRLLDTIGRHVGIAVQKARLQDRAELILGSTAEGIFGVDGEGKIIFANAAAERIIGWAAPAAIGRPLADVLAVAEPGSRAGERWVAPLETVLTEDKAWSCEVELQSHDQSSFPAEVVITPMHSRGAVAGGVVTFRDISERKAAERMNARLFQAKDAEEQVRALNAELEERVNERTAELQASMRELEAFSYSVSHDLRAPLRAMNGFSRILLDEYAPDLSPQAQRYLQIVNTNAQQMGALVDDLLAFSRLGRQPITRRPVDPAPLVRQALVDLEPDQNGRHVAITIGELPTCEADPVLLRQVYANLLGNAFKFSRSRDPARIEVGYQRHNGQPAYFVRDNGVGFDMRFADKLFGVFQRLHRAEDYEGTGVGLAIVQRIVERHGGQVWAEGEVDRGASFFFTLGGDTKT